MQKKIISHNGYSEIITVINKKSTDLIVGQDMPERADLTLSEVCLPSLLEKVLGPPYLTRLKDY